MLKLTVESLCGTGSYSLHFTTVEAASRHLDELTTDVANSSKLFYVPQQITPKKEISKLIVHDLEQNRFLVTLHTRD